MTGQTEYTEYTEFLQSKQIRALPNGIEVDASDISPMLKLFQRDIVKWAVYKGRAAVFADTGLGKTLIGLEWARLLGKRTLIIAPLAVCRQTVAMARDLLGLRVEYIRSGESVAGDGLLWITNFELVHKYFNPAKFDAVWLDESSRLKNISGVQRSQLIAFAKECDYRLATTATPAPNDVNELNNHAEFVGIVESANQFTSIWFVHEAGCFRGAKTGGARWRLKRHAVDEFYRSLASWSIAVKRPSDLGYDDDGFILPSKTVTTVIVSSDVTLNKIVKASNGEKFEQIAIPGISAQSLSSTLSKKVRRETLDDRLTSVLDLVKGNDEQWIIWCGLNAEAESLDKAIGEDSRNVHGSMTPEEKADLLEAFTKGEYRVLITKTKIAGFGLNLQNCHNMIFFGLDYSWESYYQAVRRIWRFGQQHPVNIYIVISEQSLPVLESVQQKEVEAIKMSDNLILATRTYSIEELQQNYHQDWKYASEETTGDGWTMWLGDSCERMKEITDDSIDLTIYSPPFSDLYVYTATERDLSNCTSWDQFMTHYRFIVQETLRVTKPGRLCAVHVQDMKTFKNREGYRGLKDFCGDVIKLHTGSGWIYRATVTVSKNPQIVASRNKDTDLLFVTGKRDSTDLAPVPPDYVLLFRKQGENEVPVLPYEREVGSIVEEDWIEWAYPVWTDIKETEVLNVRQARANDDEKHMCPLQLPLIARVIRLYSNAGELVFSPFAGIGSEGYEALRWRNRFLGIELKPEYYKVACQNLELAESLNVDLFQWADSSESEPNDQPAAE